MSDEDRRGWMTQAEVEAAVEAFGRKQPSINSWLIPNAGALLRDQREDRARYAASLPGVESATAEPINMVRIRMKQ
jgi:hypothetical protein